MLLSDIKSNLLYKLLEAVMIALILLASNSVLAKYLNLDDFGLYSLGMFWSLILVILTFGFSLPTLLSRELCQRGNHSSIITNLFFLQLVLGLAVLFLFAFLIFVVPYFSSLNNTGFILYILASSIMAAPISMQGILSSQERMGAICLVKVASYFLNLIALIIVARLDLGISWIFASHLILVFGFSAGFYFLSGTGKWLDFSLIDSKEIKYLFSHSAVLVLITLSLQLYSRITLVMLDVMLGRDSVAIYSAASRIMEYILLVAVALNAAVFPNLMKLADQPERFRKLFGKFIRLLIFGLFPVCITVSLFAGNLLESFYGTAYLAAAQVLQILMAASCLAFLNASFYNIFFAYKKQLIYLLICTAALVFNIAGNYLLIPSLAEKGAAFSGLLTESLFLILSLIAIRRTTSVHAGKNF